MEDRYYISDASFDQEKHDIKRAIEKFHAGEPLEMFFRVGESKKSLYYQQYLVKMVYQLGLTHVPVYTNSEIIKSEYKDSVEIEKKPLDPGEDNTSPPGGKIKGDNRMKAIGTFIKKGKLYFSNESVLTMGTI